MSTQAANNLDAALQGSDVQALWNLGSGYLGLDKFDEARVALARAVELAPKAFMARLHYGYALERLGREHDALAQYFGAITQAQMQNRWLSDETTALPLRPLVKHAMRFTYDGRKRVFEALLSPLRERHGEEALRRVADCLRIYLGELPAIYPDPRQRPKFLYFPGLPPTTYFARELFPWYEQLEQSFAAIREELAGVIAAKQGIEPFLKFHKPQDVQGYLGGIEKPVWDAYFFYRHGERYDDHHKNCPRTSAALDGVPLCRIREHAPEVCFSVLTPGTHILKHRGVTNTRLVTHLPLIVPANCAIQVGGEERVWREGECFTFDDTFEHEAWNRGDSTRVVMLLDVWNPHLTEVERGAVTALVEGIGDFNTEAGVDRE
jgi:aspartate beta-hydroxylase